MRFRDGNKSISAFSIISRLQEGFTVITPSGIETSLASFAQIESGKVVFNGGVDLFFRYSEDNPSQQEISFRIFFT